MNSFKFIFEVPNICYIVSNTVIFTVQGSHVLLHLICQLSSSFINSVSHFSLSLLCDFHTQKKDTLSYLQCIPLQRTKSAVLLSCPGPTNSLLINHSFYFLVHFSLTYIVFLFRILQFRTCPHLSPYSMLFII